MPIRCLKMSKRPADTNMDNSEKSFQTGSCTSHLSSLMSTVDKKLRPGRGTRVSHAVVCGVGEGVSTGEGEIKRRMEKSN